MASLTPWTSWTWPLSATRRPCRPWWRRGLELEEWGGAVVEDRLTRLLRTQRRLVVLDNCEHLRVELRQSCRPLAVALPAPGGAGHEPGEPRCAR